MIRPSDPPGGKLKPFLILIVGGIYRVFVSGKSLRSRKSLARPPFPTIVDYVGSGVARWSTRRRRSTKGEQVFRGSSRHGGTIRRMAGSVSGLGEMARDREPVGASPNRATVGKCKSGRAGSIICKKKMDPSFPPFSSSATSPLLFQQQPPSHHHHHPQPPMTSTPAFLSRFPRSLSSLSLGTKKKSTSEKDTGSPNITTSECLSPTGGGGHVGLNHGGPFPASGTPTKKKYSSSSVSERNHKHPQQQQQDTPPPLPQRNIPKRLDSSMDSVDTVGTRRNIVVSDLDHSVLVGGPAGNGASNKQCVSNNNNNSVSSGGGSKASGKSKRKKNGSMASEAKAEPTTMYHHGTERGGELQAEPPPLPPRQPGMMEVNQNIILNNDNVAGPFGTGNCTTTSSNNNNNNSRVGSPDARPPPNSINTLMSYPLVSTITPVRDSMASAFPFSNRLNIVQQMQQVANHETAKRIRIHRALNENLTRTENPPKQPPTCSDFSMHEFPYNASKNTQ
ncbi:conserved hypothetical protein [Culex quinquefasciatus]|uniref:Uncharacterized protein n=1 Tax=Culex quinquefasciatus TaxID=7176 RepID=B0WBG7_CULQU|nr:conserved hypothetical protein [Culex quinquefasciatus]|eukprot:XP_001846051.1 conserved hypothetical protein [Culex quinquefasciatus]